MEIFRSGQLSEGEKVEEFEEKWARYIGTKYSVAFCSGSAALFGGLLAMRNLGLLQGDVILTNPNTYVGVVNCIMLAGFSPAFVDIEPHSFGTLAVDKVSQQFESGKQISHIAGIIPVHLFGFPEKVQELRQIGTKYEKPVMEDAAQAHGSELWGRKLGSWGYFGIFSFNMGHTLQAGEMGVVTTDNSELYEQLKTVKDQGRLFRSHRTSSNWFNSEQIGFNFKTTEINATIALAQLKKVDSIIRLRRRNARLMSELLVKWDGILQLPNFPSDVCPFAYPILIQSEMISRDIICADIEGMGVETRIMFPCVPIVQPAYKNLQELYRGQLPNSERLGKQAFYVGCHQYMSEEEVSDVAQIIGHALENALAQERSNE